MRIVIQRVTDAKVLCDHELVGSCGHGLLIFAALAPNDDLKTCQKAIDKIMKMRLFDEGGQFMAKSIDEIGGEILLVSQFTLLADLDKGRRPSFSKAMPVALADVLFAQFVQLWQGQYPKLQTGRFGADMQVQLTNDGPVTLILDI